MVQVHLGPLRHRNSGAPATVRDDMVPDANGVRYRSSAGRWVIVATVLGSGIAFLDSTVVNVALPAIADDFDVEMSGLQWTMDAYLLTLGSLLLVGGSLGDLYGRRKMYVFGLASFTIASVICALAPSIEALVLARAFQGIGAALLVPGSLAIISSNFVEEDRAQAIGAWSGLSGVTTALGPFLGGWLVDAVSWRLIFFINIPIAAAAIWISIKHVDDTRADEDVRRPDIIGAVLAAAGLGGVIYALIEGPAREWPAATITAAVGGAIVLALFLWVERIRAHPMLPLDIFRSRRFSVANLMTLMVYFALSGSLFLVVIQLQKVLDYSALEAGAAFSPLTLLLLALSPGAGRFAQRVGPRIPMTFGPIVAAAGLALMMRIHDGESYLTAVLPAVVVFGLGLSLTVAPLTAAVLAAVDRGREGIGSGVNNAVARIAGLLAVALLPVVAGVTDLGTLSGDTFSEGFSRAMLVSAALCALGGVISWVGMGAEDRCGAHGPPPSVDHPHARPLEEHREPVAAGR